MSCAPRLDQSFATMWRAVRALLDGDFAEVEEIAGQLYPYARENGAWSKAHAILVLHVLREQGRLAESGPCFPSGHGGFAGGRDSMPLRSSCISGSTTTTPWPVISTSWPPTASPASPSPGPGR